jgi:hypothetical protein
MRGKGGIYLDARRAGGAGVQIPCGMGCEKRLFWKWPKPKSQIDQGMSGGANVLS